MRLRCLPATRRFHGSGHAIAVAVCFAFGALSCASQGPATRAAPIVDRTSPRPPERSVAQAARAAPERPPAEASSRAPVPADIAPLPPPRVPDVVTAPLDAPNDTASPADVPLSPPAGARSGLPAPATTDLAALILPLDIPAYGRAADAVRAGFMAAAEAAGAKDRSVVIGHAADGMLAAFEEARKRGVRVVVGPLLRDDLKTLAIADPDIPWTIALNRLDDDTPMPAAVFTFPLAVESDARVIARRALAEGVRSIDIVTGTSPLTARMAAAFTAEWVAGAGAPPATLRFEASSDTLTSLRRSLVRAVPDAVVLALDGSDAALAKPFIGALPAYASGLLFERPDAAVVRDLNDVRIVEVPWLVTPGAPEVAGFPRPDFNSAALERLYALGIDAFRASQAFGDAPPERFTLDGATGRITLEGRQFMREGRFGVYRDGRLVPLDDAPR